MKSVVCVRARVRRAVAGLAALFRLVGWASGVTSLQRLVAPSSEERERDPTSEQDETTTVRLELRLEGVGRGLAPAPRLSTP